MTAPATSTAQSPTASRSDCRCPDIPEVIDPVTGALKCRCCGRELVFTCPGECGEEHVRASFAAAREQLRAINPALRVRPPRGKETKPRAYKPKPCRGK